MARFDAELDTGLDQERVMYYDQSWRLLEERIDDDLDTDPGVDSHQQYVWGLRYIDDIAYRRVNSNFGNDDPDITYEASWYYATDALFSVVALLQGRQAVLGERVQYDAYGAARHQRSGDVNGDGDTDGADNASYLTVFNATIDQASYNVDADINRDGVINGTDGTLLTNNFGAALPKGQLSNADNIIGFDSYVFNAPDEVYTVRNRSYDFHQGRWLERDPLGYLDGHNSYVYVVNAPQTHVDPTGLTITILTEPILDSLTGFQTGSVLCTWIHTEDCNNCFSVINCVLTGVSSPGLSFGQFHLGFNTTVTATAWTTMDDCYLPGDGCNPGRPGLRCRSHYLIQVWHHIGIGPFGFNNILIWFSQGGKNGPCC